MNAQLLLIMASVAIAANSSQAQCNLWRGGLGDFTNAGDAPSIAAITTWDPDGDGPLAEQLVVGGTFSDIGGSGSDRIARFDGAQWAPVGSLAGYTTFIVLALTTWDSDGEGPMAPSLIAGGIFGRPGEAFSVAVLTDSGWQPVGDGTANNNSGPVSAVGTFDPDGTGPQTPWLLASGAFSKLGGVNALGIAYWNGSWHAMSSGIPGGVRCFGSVDLDGGGAAPVQLVVGGTFATAGAGGSNGIARWDAEAFQWFGFGSGMSSGASRAVNAVTTWDADGAGPQAPRLIAAGLFSTAGGVTVNNLAQWTGSAWAPIGLGGIGTAGEIAAMVQWDPDGLGPLTRQLVAVGDVLPGVRIARWDGSAWHAIGAGTGGDTGLNRACVWSGGGSTLALAGNFESVGGTAAEDLALWTACSPVSVCSGDANGDREVNGADVSVLLSTFGQSVVPGSGADFNADARVDGRDLSVLLSAFGDAC